MEQSKMNYSLILTEYPKGFLGNFLSKGLKTNQLELNTDEKTLRPIARLKEPRDLFALPKDKDHDCSQQAPRWPIECQVVQDRVVHMPYVPQQPEPYNIQLGHELKPRPVGEENGIVVFNYNPISAVNYKTKPLHSSSDSDISSSESRGSSPDRKLDTKTSIAKMLTTLEQRSSSNSNDELEKEDRNDKSNATETGGNNDDDDDDDDDDDEDEIFLQAEDFDSINIDKNCLNTEVIATEDNKLSKDLDDIWANKSPEYRAATPVFIKSQFGKKSSNIGADQIQVPQPVAPVRMLNQSPSSSISLSAALLDIDISRTSSTSSLTTVDVKLSFDQLTLDDKYNEDEDDDGSKTLRETVTETNMNAKKAESATLHLKEENSQSKPTSKQNLSNNTEAKNKRNSENNNNSTKSTTSTPTDSESVSNDQMQEIFNALSDLTSSNNECDKESKLSSAYILYEPQFSRSAVGGAKVLTNCHPYNPDEYDGLEFESRFESGNLAKAVMITQTYYELHLRSDLYTSRSKQWFYFRVKRMRKNVIYRFSIVNLIRSDSLYNEGMRPLMYSVINAKQNREGWRRCGTNIVYYRNEEENPNEEDNENTSYTLTFNIEFPHDNDEVYFAHSYPYTYSDLQDYLMGIQKDPIKSKFCKLRLLCRSLAGNNVYYLTVTAPSNDDEYSQKKKAIVVSARVHPSETPASWMMKGLMDYITGDTLVAKRLRHRFIFKLIPMLNPDGVIVGNTRNSLTGKDLNRQYRTVIRETYPSIWYTKAMIKRLIDECKVVLYCDMHAHSRKHNIFVYGCENKRNPEKKLTEQVFPLMLHKNVADKFSFESCKFKVQRSKEGTGRIVVWMLGITNSYTIEASFGGSLLGSRKGTHFNTADYEHIGRAFCETLMDYGDDTPNKVRRTTRFLKQIKKIRKREKREKKALKLKRMAEQERLRLKIIERLLKEGSSADEPLNIQLSDYSSDEGPGSSDSENESPFSKSFDFEGPCCAATKVPPSSPISEQQQRKDKYKQMRKALRELDRIYFQPLFQKKFRCLMRWKRQSNKKRSKKTVPKKSKNQKETNIIIPSTQRLEGGGVATGVILNRNFALLNNSGGNAGDEVGIVSKPVEGVETSTIVTTNGRESTCNEVYRDAHGDSSSTALDGTSSSPSTANEYFTSVEPATDESQLDTTTKNNPEKKRKRKEDNCLKAPPPSQHQRMKVSRKFRLWLAEHKIILHRQKSKHFRVKIRRSHLQRKKSDTKRIALDLPTTDPSSDLLFSTDEEFGGREEREYLKQYGTVPRTRRIHLQSELQRRYIEEIGDGSDNTTTRAMPPELIVTQAKGPKFIYRPTQINTHGIPKIQEQPAVLDTLEFPVTFKPGRRTNSWHNLHQNNTNNTSKATYKYKIRDPYKMEESESQEELQIKLSLKKKYWTGMKHDNANNTEGLNRRPFSLNQHNPKPATRKLKTSSDLEKGRQDFRMKLADQELQKADNEAFLNACSRKLLTWQQELHNMSKTLNNKSETKTNTHLDFNMFVPEVQNSERTMRIFRKVAYSKKEQKAPTKQEILETKLKRRINPLTKLTETTQIFTRFTSQSKTHNSSSTQSVLLSRSSNFHSALPPNNSKLRSSSNNRFKTGGLVATAVQPMSNKKYKKVQRMHKPALLMMGDGSNSGVGIGMGIANRDNIPMKAAHSKANISLKSTLSSNTFVRKVKSKLHKKRSTMRTTCKEANGIEGGNGANGKAAVDICTPRISNRKTSTVA